MERKKVALEMTKNAVIRQANNFRPKAKNSTVAPKSVQIPAYNHKTPMTFYSNMAVNYIFLENPKVELQYFEFSCIIINKKTFQQLLVFFIQ